MSFRQVYVRKEVWPKVILKRLSVSLTHPYQCTKCPQRFHKFYEATAHYHTTHHYNDLLEKEISENEIKIKKLDDQIKNEFKEEIKFETEVHRGLKILEKLELPIENKIRRETNKNQEAKSPYDEFRENEDLQFENCENEEYYLVAKSNEKIVEFDFLQIEEAEINFSEGQEETDHLVHAHSANLKNLHFLNPPIFNTSSVVKLNENKVDFDREDLNTMNQEEKSTFKKAVQGKEIKKANNKIIKPKNVNLNPKSVNLKPAIDASKKEEKGNQMPENKSRGVFNVHVHNKNQEDRKKYLAAKQLKVISKKFMKVKSL